MDARKPFEKAWDHPEPKWGHANKGAIHWGIPQSSAQLTLCGRPLSKSRYTNTDRDVTCMRCHKALG